MKRRRYSKGQDHGKEKSVAAMHEDLISYSGLSPVSVGHLPAGHWGNLVLHVGVFLEVLFTGHMCFPLVL